MRFGRSLGYRVLLEATAEQDALEYAAYILSRSESENVATRWLSGLESSIDDLANSPHRFRLIDEQAKFDVELRQFIYYSHRVIYHVNDETRTVHVLRIYHGRRDGLTPDALPAILTIDSD